MKTFQVMFAVAACATMGFGALAPSLANAAEAYLTPPALKASPGFTAQILVPPGKVYDPLFVARRGDEVWFNDDGGKDEKRGTGGRIWSVDKSGQLTVVADTNLFTPITGWDFAPTSWGKDAGKVVGLSIPRIGKEGAYEANIIQTLDPKQKFAATKICTLPLAGNNSSTMQRGRPSTPAGENMGIPSLGADARFGPEGSGFAGKFFALTLYNDAIYQVTADGVCKPFLVLDGKHRSRPNQIAFTLDNKTMLVVVAIDANTANEHGGVIRVTPEGKIEKTYINAGSNRAAFGISVAPKGFGDYEGHIFLSGAVFEGAPGTPERKRVDNAVYRVAPDGTIHPVVSGFYSIYNINFIDSERLFVSDIRGDYIVGGVEVPDGTVTVIRVAK